MPQPGLGIIVLVSKLDVIALLLRGLPKDLAQVACYLPNVNVFNKI
ncbi:hypothetical protein Krac_3191 [Ktedonobacter racemifer DSM 44963]|uniref:Uncharacterized protein n=1 Tax=Ktedonobacter racemifer DSM 44963 TaxID=485913 RepID=D6U0P2_KTERA|nr:hypothetical protein Krac_3191 [Ktedonobacter racemifer DSM 44963]